MKREKSAEKKTEKREKNSSFLVAFFFYHFAMLDYRWRYVSLRESLQSTYSCTHHCSIIVDYGQLGNMKMLRVDVIITIIIHCTHRAQLSDLLQKNSTLSNQRRNFSQFYRAPTCSYWWNAFLYSYHFYVRSGKITRFSNRNWLLTFQVKMLNQLTY